MIQYRSQLVDLMKILDLPLVGVEVGVAEGQFSRDLLEAGLLKLYSVDAWEQLNQKGDGGSPNSWHEENYKKAKELLAKFGDRSIILKGLSHEMAKQVPDNSLGLAYFDGDHSYEGVKSDLETWYPKVVSGGIIGTHDYEMEQYGTKKAFEEFVGSRFEIFLLPENKKEDAGAFFIKP